ncbi:hypothetical protein HanRHA438_Chr13g0593881 [Helianthus annuus]|nr:hypothetical protein HanIR_Chr13g0634901 [Helianthus annuus]KAJ0857768.1 hypothetical protein HanRHA438_Chr13g0593881 [Helianthus annuus]
MLLMVTYNLQHAQVSTENTKFQVKKEKKKHNLQIKVDYSAMRRRATKVGRCVTTAGRSVMALLSHTVV